MRGDAQAVAALLGEVDDEPLVGEDLEQVVGGRARESRWLAIVAAGRGCAWRASRRRTLSAWVAAGAFGMELAPIVSGTRQSVNTCIEEGQDRPARQGRVV